MNVVLSNRLLSLSLHPSLWVGLASAASLRAEVGPAEAARLNDWADNVCDNPAGQRAALARAVAALAAVEPLRVQPGPPTARGFWEASG